VSIGPSQLGKPWFPVGFEVEDDERRLGLGKVRESLREERGFRGGG